MRHGAGDHPEFPDQSALTVRAQSPGVIARSEATKQSILSLRGEMDCFASLAMTGFPYNGNPT